MRTRAIVYAAAFAATIPAANWMIGHVGNCSPLGPCTISVGFGLIAPSGVLMIGLALVLRDQLHEDLGWRACAVAILLGSCLSVLIAPASTALASGAAFLFSEVADTLVYQRLRARSRAWAVLASQAVGSAIDSVIFVVVAFGSLDLSLGTTVAKIYAGAAFAALIWMRGKRLGGK